MNVTKQQRLAFFNKGVIVQKQMTDIYKNDCHPVHFLIMGTAEQQEAIPYSGQLSVRRNTPPRQQVFDYSSERSDWLLQIALLPHCIPATNLRRSPAIHTSKRDFLRYP
jgi:hypothetical protein